MTANQDAQHVTAARQVQVDQVMAGTHSHNVYKVSILPGPHVRCDSQACGYFVAVTNEGHMLVIIEWWWGV